MERKKSIENCDFNITKVHRIPMCTYVRVHWQYVVLWMEKKKKGNKKNRKNNKK